ncbi:MAG: FecR domain-containing protein, partial [Polyangiaceae bacterium]|nr:FecR domain-containing protein [Polyangiaceae bacterium]
MNTRNYPMLRSLLSRSATIALLLSTGSFAQQAETYTVKKGDTCESLSIRFYGDPRLTDVLHAGNPKVFTTKPPHTLKEGLLLSIPPKPADRAAGPDAKLNFARNQVQLQAPDARVGKINDPLWRGNRVNTLAESSASVLFQDESQIRLGEHTLVVILGDTKSAGAKQSNASDTTLVSGDLVARLGQLQGEAKAKPLVLKTQAGSVAVKEKGGEARISVDEKKTTRLASYKGASELTAQKKSVNVPEGFGSKADDGKAPTAPKALPAAPVWAKAPANVVWTEGEQMGMLAGKYQMPAGAAAPATWHVQIAKDDTFDELLVDARVGGEKDELLAKNVPVGAYFSRVSAIDADKFEGTFSRPSRTIVAAVTETVSGETRSIQVTPSGLWCAVDDTHPMSVSGPIVLPTDQAHVLRCGEAMDTAATLERAFPQAKVERFQVAGKMGKLAEDKKHVEVTLLATTQNGKPLEPVTYELPKAVTVEKQVREGDEDRLTLLIAEGAPAKLKVIAKHKDGAVAESNEMDLPAPGIKQKKIGYEIELGTGVAFVGNNLSIPGFRFVAAGLVRFDYKNGAGFAVGPQFGFEMYPGARTGVVSTERDANSVGLW